MSSELALKTLEILQAHGRPMLLKTHVGSGATFAEKTVHGFAVGYRPEEIIGSVIQGDRRIRISPLELDAGTKIRKGDLLDGAAIQGAELKYDGSNPVVWVVWVRG